MDWAQRVVHMAQQFPGIRTMNWDEVLRDDPMMMASLVGDVVKVDPDSTLKVRDPTIDHLRKLLSEHYSDQEFGVTFEILTRGQTPQRIAERTKLQPAYVKRLQAGQVAPTIKNMEVIATTYGKDPDFFLEYRVAHVLKALSDHLLRSPETTDNLYAKLCQSNHLVHV